MGSKTKAIEKKDEMLNMKPHHTENILDENLNIHGSGATE